MKTYEEQELTMQVMSEFDASNIQAAAAAAAAANNSMNGMPNVTVDAEWTPERRANMEFSQVNFNILYTRII